MNRKTGSGAQVFSDFHRLSRYGYDMLLHAVTETAQNTEQRNSLTQLDNCLELGTYPKVSVRMGNL